MQALLDRGSQTGSPFGVVGLVTDRKGAGAIARADDAKVPSAVVAPDSYRTRPEWDQALASAIAQWNPDWVVSAGFMRLLGAACLSAFPGRIVNTHPALLPSFPGAHGVRDALAYGVRVTGCTVHLVDQGMDTGPVLSQASVAVEEGDDEATLHERIKAVERKVLVATVERLVTTGCAVDGRKVRWG